MGSQGGRYNQHLIVLLFDPARFATTKVAFLALHSHHLPGSGKLKPLLGALMGFHFGHLIALSLE
jgi:hypothetical protein